MISPVNSSLSYGGAKQQLNDRLGLQEIDVLALSVSAVTENIVTLCVLSRISVIF